MDSGSLGKRKRSHLVWPYAKMQTKKLQNQNIYIYIYVYIHIYIKKENNGKINHKMFLSTAHSQKEKRKINKYPKRDRDYNIMYI